MCDRRSCMYHSQNNRWGCDFSDITGTCRLSMFTKEERDAHKCYKKGKHPRQEIIIGGGRTPLTFTPRKCKYDWDLAKQLYDKGLNDPEIAEALTEKKLDDLCRELGVDELTDEQIYKNTCKAGSVFGWRKKHTLAANSVKCPTAERHEELLALYEECGSDREIAERSGFSAFTIFRWRVENNLPCKGRPQNLHDADLDTVVEALDSGMKETEIAKTFNINSEQLHEWIKKRNTYSEGENK